MGYEPPTLEGLIAAIKESPNEWSSQIIQAVMQSYGVDNFYASQVRLDNGDEEWWERGIEPASMRIELPPPPMLFFGIYKGGLTQIAGQTGAGKSSFMYNIADAASKGEMLWGLDFPEPLRILFLDPENKGWIRQNKKARLDAYNDNLFFHDADDVDLNNPQQALGLAKYVNKHNIDAVIADPRNELFGDIDENSNQEGTKTTRNLLNIVDDTGCAFVVMDHTGKNEENWMGRGNSARAGKAHVIMSFTTKKNEKNVDDDFQPDNPRLRSDVCRLRIHKDRFLGIDASIYLQMAGNDQFIRVGPDSWNNDPDNNLDRIASASKAAESILSFMSDAGINSYKNCLTIGDISHKLQSVGHTNASVIQGLALLLKEDKVIKLKIDSNTVKYYRK